MKFILIALLSSLASVTGQLAAPEVTVYYVNEQAAASVCTETELLYIDSKMVPDMDMALLSNNYETPEWDFTVDATRRKLGSTCDWCRTMYTTKLCNSMYNCGFRRQLRQAPQVDSNRELATVQLRSDLLQSCEYNIMVLSTSQFLSQTCRLAIGAATCHVQFV